MNNHNAISWKLVGVAVVSLVVSVGCDTPPPGVGDAAESASADNLVEAPSALLLQNTQGWVPLGSACSPVNKGSDECDENCELGDTCFYSQRDFDCQYRDYDPVSKTWFSFQGFKVHGFQCADIPFTYRNEQGNGCLSTETPEKLRNCDRNTPARRFKLVEGRLRSDAGLCLTADPTTAIVSTVACPKAKLWKYDTDRRWFRLQGDGRCLSTRTGAVGDVMRLHECSTAAARMRWTIKPKD